MVTRAERNIFSTLTYSNWSCLDLNQASQQAVSGCGPPGHCPRRPCDHAHGRFLVLYNRSADPRAFARTTARCMSPSLGSFPAFAVTRSAAWWAGDWLQSPVTRAVSRRVLRMRRDGLGGGEVMVLADAELTQPERQLVLAASNGELVDLRAGDAHLDHPSQAGRWEAARTVRADLLTELLTGRRQSETGAVRAVKLAGARITGVLDLEAARLACPLLLDGCSVDEPINLMEAQAEAIRLPGSYVPGIAAGQLHTEGNLEFNNGFTASAGICLAGAHIGGRLDLDDARLNGAGSPALDADGLTVRLSMFCRHGFTAHGEVRLRTAQIGGQLNFIEASLTNPGGRVLAALGLTVGQDMFCHGLSVAEGEIRMTGARIGGQLDFSGASL